MKMLSKKKILLILGALLVVISGAVYATNSRVVWTPSALRPNSIVPGGSASFLFTLTNSGPASTPDGLLALQVSPELRNAVTVSASFPKVFIKGGVVPVTAQVRIASGTPIGVLSGSISLVRKLQNGAVQDVFSNALPVEITVSNIPLPPNPGEAGKVTVEGVITNQYKIRDDVLRAIVFAYPTSEPIRNAFIQYSQADQKMAEDYLALQNDPVEQKRVVRLDAKEGDKAMDCLVYVFGVDALPTLDERLARLDLKSDARHALDLVFLNTKERSRTYNKADALLGGTTSDSVVASEQAAHNAASCDTNLLD